MWSPKEQKGFYVNRAARLWLWPSPLIAGPVLQSAGHAQTAILRCPFRLQAASSQGGFLRSVHWCLSHRRASAGRSPKSQLGLWGRLGEGFQSAFCTLRAISAKSSRSEPTVGSSFAWICRVGLIVCSCSHFGKCVITAAGQGLATSCGYYARVYFSFPN